ncbi:MAG: branched-chain amino acid ABC transporter permease [Acidimicrobiales bacterium]
MALFLQRVIDGLSNGAIFAVVAIALVLIFKATTLINFAQGELAMLGAFLFYVFAVQAFELPLIVAAIIAMALSSLLGVTIERVLVRPFDPQDHLPVVLITLGIFYIVNAVAGDVWNYESRAVPSIFPNGFDDFVSVGGARIFYDSIGMMVGLGLMYLAVYLILNKTKMGLAFRAVSSNTESSRLVGIRVGRILSFGWAAACAFGTLGAILVAPRLTLHPNMMAPILVYALAGAAFGGLDSIGGAAIGGIVVGLINSVGLGYLTGFEPFEAFRATPLVPPVILLLTVLWFRPSGMFGTKRIERV